MAFWPLSAILHLRVILSDQPNPSFLSMLFSCSVRTRLNPYWIPTILPPPGFSINSSVPQSVRPTLFRAVGSTTSPHDYNRPICCQWFDGLIGVYRSLVVFIVGSDYLTHSSKVKMKQKFLLSLSYWF